MIVIVVVAEHPLASVTVKVCVPAGRVNEPVPEYGAVPPVIITHAVPLLNPQLAGVVDVVSVSITPGSDILNDVLAVHPLLSVTVTV